MIDSPRKKSPRAPSIALEEALSRAMRAYDKERLHPAPTDVVAQHLGYKGASSGAALSALASLRYFGLLERPKEGYLAVTKDVETLKFAPNEGLKKSLLLSFLRRPALFAELLDQYASGLPSDAAMKYDLIQRGFLPTTAGSVVSVFRRSIEFAGITAAAPSSEADSVAAQSTDTAEEPPAVDADEESETRQFVPAARCAPSPAVAPVEGAAEDEIPVRLTGGRRARLIIPTPFYKADKLRLKAQIDLLLTEDEEAD